MCTEGGGGHVAFAASLPVGTFRWQEDVRSGAVISLDAVKERYSLFQRERVTLFHRMAFSRLICLC